MKHVKLHDIHIHTPFSMTPQKRRETISPMRWSIISKRKGREKKAHSFLARPRSACPACCKVCLLNWWLLEQPRAWPLLSLGGWQQSSKPPSITAHSLQRGKSERRKLKYYFFHSRDEAHRAGRSENNTCKMILVAYYWDSSNSAPFFKGRGWHSFRQPKSSSECTWIFHDCVFTVL